LEAILAADVLKVKGLDKSSQNNIHRYGA